MNLFNNILTKLRRTLAVKIFHEKKSFHLIKEFLESCDFYFIIKLLLCYITFVKLEIFYLIFIYNNMPSFTTCRSRF